MALWMYIEFFVIFVIRVLMLGRIRTEIILGSLVLVTYTVITNHPRLRSLRLV